MLFERCNEVKIGKRNLNNTIKIMAHRFPQILRDDEINPTQKTSQPRALNISKQSHFWCFVLPDVSHKPSGRLPLLSARPAVTPAILKRAATNFAAWWIEAQWVWTVCLRLLPDSVATAIWTRVLLRLSPARYPLGYRATLVYIVIHNHANLAILIMAAILDFFSLSQTLSLLKVSCLLPKWHNFSPNWWTANVI